MYERRIEYKDLSFIENTPSNTKNSIKDRTGHSFGFIHNIPEEEEPKDAEMSDKSEEVKKAHFESAVALKPEGLVTPQPVRKKREMAAYPKSNSHRNTKLINTKSNNEMRPQNLFEKNRFRAKHRSKSPVNKEVNSKTKTKIITFDSDSENKVNPIADNESEIQLEGVDFDTSGDSSEELVSDNFEEKQKSASVDEEEFYFTKNECVIIASIKLPLKAIKDENGKFKLISSGSLLFFSNVLS